MRKGKSILKMGFMLLLVATLTSACGGSASTSTPSTGTNTTETAKTETKNTGEAAATGKVIKMVQGSYIASTSPLTKNVLIPWGERIEKETNGRITTEFQAGGTLGGQREVVQNISGGAYDFGFMTPIIWPDYPIITSTVGGLPFAFVNSKDNYKNHKVIERYVEEYNIKDDYRKVGLELMGIGQSTAIVLISTAPIRTLEDLKGKKMIAESTSTAELIKSWGAIPVSITLADAYTGLERGAVDIITYGDNSLMSMGFHEVAPYITRLNFRNETISFVMSAKFYDGLPDDLKTIMEEKVNPEVVKFNADSNTNVTNQKMIELAEAIKGKGEIIVMPKEEQDKFLEAAKPTWQKWVDDVNKLGYNGKELLEGFVRIMKEEGIEPPFELDFIK